MAAISTYPADISKKVAATVQTSTTQRYVILDSRYEYGVRHTGRQVDATAGVDPVILAPGASATALTFAADDNKHPLEDGESVTFPAGHTQLWFGLIAGAATAPVLSIVRGAYMEGKF